MGDLPDGLVGEGGVLRVWRGVVRWLLAHGVLHVGVRGCCVRKNVFKWWTAYDVVVVEKGRPVIVWWYKAENLKLKDCVVEAALTSHRVQSSRAQKANSNSRKVQTANLLARS